MGLDDILQEKQERAAAQRAGVGDAIRDAQTRRLAFAKRVESELSDALKATGDPALSSPTVQKIIGSMGVSSAVQIDCQGRHGTTHFQATVTCEPGAEATCSWIKVVLPNGTPAARYRPTTKTAFSPDTRIRESEFSIEPADLHRFISNLAGRT